MDNNIQNGVKARHSTHGRPPKISQNQPCTKITSHLPRKRWPWSTKVCYYKNHNHQNSPWKNTNVTYLNKSGNKQLTQKIDVHTIYTYTPKLSFTRFHKIVYGSFYCYGCQKPFLKI